MDSRNARGAYAAQRRKARDGLAQLKRLPIFAGQYAGMPRYMASAFHASRVRLAHELANLTDTDVIRDAQGNVERNPNSIMYILGQLGDRNGKHLRFVSPYLFLAKYRDRTGELVTDEAKQIRAWLDEDPGRTVEIITNSVLSSDNVPAQAIIDMDTAPRLLLTEALQAAWLAGRKSELDPEVVQSEAWQRMVSHPRLALYQTGRLDSRLIGGTADYGKLHAKFMLQDDVGFIGTSNFDYRSRLYNNEMGFFFNHDGLAADVNAAFDALKATSYRWGSPEWLEMRQKTMAAKGKGWSARNQRTIFKGIYGLGLHWFF